jgi:hypothetical protein
MTEATVDDSRQVLRRAIYGLLIAIAIGNAVGRIFSVNSVDKVALEKNLIERSVAEEKKKLVEAGKSGEELEQLLAEHTAKAQVARKQQRPFLSGNDRSRWMTARALVEHGTYRIDDVIQEPGWDTIDMVKHDDAGNAAYPADQGHLYSSKPPLFSTLMAGEYWVIHKVTGKTLGTHPYEIGRFMLITINVTALAVMLVSLAVAAERFGATDYGRVFMVASAAFGTLLTTFVIAINNHLIAASSAALCLAIAFPIWYDNRREWWRFALVGFLAAFTVTNELPALAFFGLLGLGFLFRWPRETLLAATPAALVVAVAYFGTVYAAHGTWVPPYGQRADENNWYRYEFHRNGKVVESYWNDRLKRSPVDQGEEDQATYALHALVGHHGIFSLTPIWLLTIPGLALYFRRDGETDSRRALAAFIAILSLVCIVFFLLRPLDDRNYGGTSIGFRWVFWLAPLWLIGLLPAADWCATTRTRRTIAAVLLGLSAISVSFPTWNPWTHPWLMQFMHYLGWVRM